MNGPLLWALWVVNGLLAVVYTLLDHLALLAAIPPLFWLAAAARREHSLPLAGVGALVVLAAVLVPAPAPAILAVMAWAGALAVRLDRFNPTALRWRVGGGLALYALAALGFAAYAAYTSRLDPRVWAGILAAGEAAAVVAQGRSFLTTIAVWALWALLPLGYLALLIQGLLVHPPLPAAPADLIHLVRARGMSEREMGGAIRPWWEGRQGGAGQGAGRGAPGA